MLLCLLPGVLAASLDNLEVGGPWGTPTATDATAAWWNPAGLAAGEGTRLMLEVAPTFATITYERAEPHGGQDTYELSGAVPYAGVATDLGVDGLGIGAALAVPIVRGGAEVTEPGSGAYHMRHGDSRALYVLLGGGYEIADRVALGVVGAYVRSSWTASAQTETLPDLVAAIEEEDPTAELDYTDEDLEDPRYAANLRFGELTDDAFTFGLGARVQVTPEVAVGVAFHKGVYVNNAGDLTIVFDCPPQEDEVARFAAESRGLCYGEVNAKGSVGYQLPSRVQAGVTVTPVEYLRLEAFGGWVGWAVYDDFDIVVSDSGLTDEQTRAMIEKEQTWARANRNSAWGGVDAKATVAERWTFGARLVYDAAAVPDEALSTNNYDANAWMLSALAAWQAIGPLQVGASWTRQFLEERTVTTSGFGMSLSQPTETRWNYPHANGTYGGNVDRIGIAVRSQF